MYYRGKSEPGPYRVLGLMSGTSLDGLDLCLSEFWEEDGGWRYRIEDARTESYSNEWLLKLKNSFALSGTELCRLDRDYGHYLGRTSNAFLAGRNVDLISSHGHTVFHRPDLRFTLQIGHGGALQVEAGCMVVNDFRSEDVALGGQGAPLVPVGDALLFSKYDGCLNLGGFSNLSWKTENNERRAGDIVPVNLVFSHLVSPLGLDYDAGGELGLKGKVQPALLTKLQELPLMQRNFPRSFGREDLEREVIPLLNSENESIFDALATCREWMAMGISDAINKNKISTCLLSGGGSYNTGLVESIRAKTDCRLEVGSSQEIEFKEALIFGFLGLLRVLGRENVWKEVTGASESGSRGSIWGNF